MILVPDFRSASGLFKTLRSQQRLKASGKHLFDASVYKHDDSTESFHKMVRDLAQLTRNAKPTPFHHMLASIAEEGRLLRLYSQNVDCIETSMKPLETSVPLNCKGPWPKTIQLHGGLEKMVCTKCGHLAPFDASLFEGPEPPPCRVCTEDDLVRTAHAGKRSHGIGRMRPRIVLYNEYNPDEEAIGMVSTADLRSRPDAVIVVGTSLKIPGVRRLVKEMCQVTKGRADGFTAWINVDPEPAGPEFKDCWDLVVRAECDDVATLVDLPRWNDRRGLDDSAEVDEASEQVFQRNLVEIPLAEKESDLTKMRSARNKAAAERLQSKLLGQDVRESTGILTPGSTPKMRGKTLPAIKPSFLSLVKPARVRTIVKSETSSESESTQKKATKRAPPKKPRKATQAVRKQGETLRNVFQVTKKVAGPVDTKPSSVRPPTSSPFALAFEAPRSPLQGSYARSKGLRDDAIDAADSGSQQQRQQLADLAPAPVILPTPPSSHPRSDRSDFSLRPSQSHEYSPSPAGARAPSFSRADFAISASSTSPSHRDNGPTPGNLFPSSPFRTASGGMTGHFSLSPFRTGPAHTVPSPSSKHCSPQPAATRPFARSPFAAPTASTSAPQEPPRQQQDKQSRGFVQSSVLHFMGLLGGRPRTPPPASSGGSKFGGDSVELASSPLSSPPRTPRTPNTVMAVESICH